MWQKIALFQIETGMEKLKLVTNGKLQSPFF